MVLIVNIIVFKYDCCCCSEGEIPIEELMQRYGKRKRDDEDNDDDDNDASTAVDASTTSTGVTHDKNSLTAVAADAAKFQVLFRLFHSSCRCFSSLYVILCVVFAANRSDIGNHQSTH